MARSLGWQPGVGAKVKCRWAIQVQGCGAVAQALLTWGQLWRWPEAQGTKRTFRGLGWDGVLGKCGVSLGRAAKQGMLWF